MTQIELQQLLDNIYELSFLESILLIQEKDSLYKKSDFFKQTKIPLVNLYEKYFIYMNSKYSIEDKLNDFITKIDIDILTNLSLEWIDRLQNNEKFQDLVKITLEKFDFSKLKEEQEKIEGIISDIKK